MLLPNRSVLSTGASLGFNAFFVVSRKICPGLLLAALVLTAVRPATSNAANQHTHYIRSLFADDR